MRIFSFLSSLSAAIRVVVAAVLVMALDGCQASLFHTLNATAGGGKLDVRTDVVFDPTHQLAMDIYGPAHARHLPTVVFFYGGSWQDGERQWYRWMGETLARHGLIVAIPDYRKYPQVHMDGFMADAANAVAWMHAHTADYGGDPGRMFLMGHSAGAHIAALLATDGRWLGRVGLEPQNLAGFIGLAGPYDFLPLTDPAFIGMFGATPSAQARSQPVNFVDGDEPPMLLLQGTGDHRVQPRNATSMAERMHAQHEAAALRMYPGVGHTGLLLSFSKLLRGHATGLRDTLEFIEARSAALPGGATTH